MESIRKFTKFFMWIQEETSTPPLEETHELPGVLVLQEHFMESPPVDAHSP